MNNFIDMNDVEQLIIDKLTGQIGDEEETRLEGLIARHSEVEQLWQQMQQVYAMRKAVSFENSFNADTAWTAMQQKLSLPTTPQQNVPDTVAIHPKQRIHWMRYAVAAAATGIIVVAAWLLIDYNSAQQPSVKYIEVKTTDGKVIKPLPGDDLSTIATKYGNPAGWNTLTVPAGKSYNFQLGDKTEVWLNSQSECSFPLIFPGIHRNVLLKGEGYFNVAHNPSQPFIVTVNGLTVRALGTEFNIKSYPHEVTVVALVKGSVSVQYNGGNELVLQPGESAVLHGDRLRKERFDEQVVTAWLKGLYIYYDERLDSIAAIAERWFDVDVQLNEPAMAGMRFTGELNRNKPVDNFFSLLASTGNLHYENKNGKILLSRK